MNENQYLQIYLLLDLWEILTYFYTFMQQFIIAGITRDI